MGISGHVGKKRGRKEGGEEEAEERRVGNEIGEQVHALRYSMNTGKPLSQHQKGL